MSPPLFFCLTIQIHWPVYLPSVDLDPTDRMAVTSYNDEFEQHLVRNSIFSNSFQFSGNPPQPKNLKHILSMLRKQRSELSHISESEFHEFRRLNSTASRGTLMRRIIPTLDGDANILNDRQLSFDNMAPLFKEAAMEVMPDYFDGAPFHTVNLKVRDALGGIIIPTRHINAPVAPNFVLEVRKSSGNAVTTEREVCYYGACGARLMHSLQNYVNGSTTTYDGNAYAFSSTYINGILRLYAHFIPTPAMPWFFPRYHMVELRVFNMMCTHKDLVDGCAAFRNIRELAAWFRNDFIEHANEETWVMTYFFMPLLG